MELKFIYIWYVLFVVGILIILILLKTKALNLKLGCDIIGYKVSDLNIDL